LTRAAARGARKHLGSLVAKGSAIVVSGVRTNARLSAFFSCERMRCQVTDNRHRQQSDAHKVGGRGGGGRLRAGDVPLRVPERLHCPQGGDREQPHRPEPALPPHTILVSSPAPPPAPERHGALRSHSRGLGAALDNCLHPKECRVSLSVEGPDPNARAAMGRSGKPGMWSVASAAPSASEIAA
jgi:hypothetical protein